MRNRQKQMAQKLAFMYLPELREKMQTAGIQKVVDELQAQIDAYLGQ